MIEFVEDRHVWVPGPREFRLVHDEPHALVDVDALRPDVTLDRAAHGWTLIGTAHLEENAQQLLVDLWTRSTERPPTDDPHGQVAERRRLKTIIEGHRNQHDPEVADQARTSTAHVRAIYQVLADLEHEPAPTPPNDS